MIILGLNAYHGDSSAALVVDGQLKAAVEEERFSRIKHWAGLPVESVRFCLQHEGMTLADVDVIAINQDSSAHLWQKVRYTLTRLPSPSLVLQKLRTRRGRQNVVDALQEKLGDSGFRGEMLPVEHHLAHLASSFYVSPFSEATLVSVDGFGDFTSTAWGSGRESNIDITGRIFFPHSLGSFYQAMTQYLGFPNYGDEYKVMGLAPYGKPTAVDTLRKLVRLTDDGFELNLDYFRHHKDDISFEWRGGAPVFDRLYSSALEDLLGPARSGAEQMEDQHRDLAHSIQAVYEEAFFHLLSIAHAQYPSDNLALSGGCAMNSVANGKVRLRSPFTRLYVQSAAGDAGGAIGAAFAIWHQQGGDRGFVMDHAYWGPAWQACEIEACLAARQADLVECRVEQPGNESELLDQITRAIADGLVVGWFEGALEWGPRALGHRSILGDPRRADMKDILNEKIKRRESFRPFAPSVLREQVDTWFEQDDDVPFMMKVFQIREEKRELIPAVTHVDGSGRLQTVSASANGRYYRLIKAFFEKTGVPLVLNTSFNENEPIVCRPEEALDCFLRTRMDVLVLENTVITRK